MFIFFKKHVPMFQSPKDAEECSEKYPSSLLYTCLSLKTTIVPLFFYILLRGWSVHLSTMKSVCVCFSFFNILFCTPPFFLHQPYTALSVLTLPSHSLLTRFSSGCSWHLSWSVVDLSLPPHLHLSPNLTPCTVLGPLIHPPCDTRIIFLTPFWLPCSHAFPIKPKVLCLKIIPIPASPPHSAIHPHSCLLLSSLAYSAFASNLPFHPAAPSETCSKATSSVKSSSLRFQWKWPFFLTQV